MKESAPKIKKTEEKDSTWWMEYIPAYSYENAETYLDRVTHEISSTMLIDSFLDKEEKLEKFLDWKEVDPHMIAEMKKLVHKIPEQMPAKMLRQELYTLDSSISIMTNRVEEEINDRNDYFDQTIRERNFHTFIHGEGPLEKSLFQLVFLDEDHKNEMLKNRIENKTIILLGGGNALNDLIQGTDLKPKKVINIDSFLRSEPIDKNNAENYESFPYKAQDPELKNKGLPKADEIWATWSVPLYLEKSTDIEQLFKNVDDLLTVGGVFRIYPLYLLNFKAEDEKVFDDHDSFDERRKTWVRSVAELLKTGKYNMHVLDHRTMYLQKISE